MYFAPDNFVRALGKHASDVKKGKLIIVSFDAVPAQINLLREGYCTTLIGQRAYDMGAKSMEALNQIVQGKKVSDIDTGVEVINAANIQKFRAKDR
jgi:ribose transport system substrate-binding protein